VDEKKPDESKSSEKVIRTEDQTDYRAVIRGRADARLRQPLTEAQKPSETLRETVELEKKAGEQKKNE